MITKILIIIILIEFTIQILVKKIKKNFQWFLLPEDLYPNFDKAKFKKYLSNSYSKKFGWIRKSNLVGYDKLNDKKIKFIIDKKGFRKPKNQKKMGKIASFGGSFVFGRQVENHQTWQEQITKNKNYNILNYGIGNYGTDQAILRYKYTKFEPKNLFF